MKFLLLIVVFLMPELLLGQSFTLAQKRDTIILVPSVIMREFQQFAPNAKKVFWKKYIALGDTSYQVSYRQNGILDEAMFNNGGIILEYSKEINLDALPKAVRKAIFKSIRYKWVEYPSAVVRVQVEATCKNKICTPIKWTVSTYSSVAEAIKENSSGSLFFVSEKGHVWYPKFR